MVDSIIAMGGQLRNNYHVLDTDCLNACRFPGLLRIAKQSDELFS